MKEWTPDEIRVLLKTKDWFVYKALVQLYLRQTKAERRFADTDLINGFGFNQYDAPALTEIAEYVKPYLDDPDLIDDDFRDYLRRHLRFVRHRITKYAKQLTIIANAKAKRDSIIEYYEDLIAEAQDQIQAAEKEYAMSTGLIEE